MDFELVRKAGHGEMGAFHALVDRHAPYLYGLAVSLVGNATDAEDVMQETLTGAFRGLRGFQERSSVKTWLTQILVRQAAVHVRRNRHRPGPSPLPLDALPSRTPAANRTDLRLDLTQALLALNFEHREILVLRELQGLSYDEIAGVLAIPRGTVESRLHRARRAIHELMTEYRT